MPGPSRRALQLQAGATSRSSQSRSVNQTNFLAELHTRTDEQAALEDQANEEFHEAQERDLTVSALAEQQRRQKLLEKQQKAKARKQRNVRSLPPTCSLLPGMMKVFFRLHNFLTARLLRSSACALRRSMANLCSLRRRETLRTTSW